MGRKASSPVMMGSGVAQQLDKFSNEAHFSQENGLFFYPLFVNLMVLMANNFVTLVKRYMLRFGDDPCVNPVFYMLGSGNPEDT